jgi:hypothetical protein
VLLQVALNVFDTRTAGSCAPFTHKCTSVPPSCNLFPLQVALNVFDTRSGKKLRIFGGNMEDYAIGSSAGPGGALRWPIFK